MTGTEAILERARAGRRPSPAEAAALVAASDMPHPLIRPFDLARFETGRLIDESVAAGVGH